MPEEQSTQNNDKLDSAGKQDEKSSRKENHHNKSVTKTDNKETNGKVVRFYNAEIDKNLIKKKGFLIALEGNGEAKTAFDGELKVIDIQYDNLFTEYKESIKKIIDNLKETDSRNKASLAALEQKLKEYEDKVKGTRASKKEIEDQLKKVQEDVYKILAEIGKAKENIVDNSLKNFKTNIELGIKISRDVQNEQNKELEDEYGKFKSSDEEKIKFWTKILQNHQDQYDKVTGRIKVLAKDGINHQTSAFLIFLGTVAALVSGWWFSIWTDSAEESKLKNVPNSDSVRFFFLDNLSKFLASHTISEVVYGLTAYIVLVGTVSWICYYLLIKFGFIQSSKRSKNSRSDTENSEDFEVKLQENDDVLKTTFKGNSWWVIWLKIAPVIFAFVPVLYIMSYTSQMTVNGTEQNGFQSLFDGLVNQFIGSCIAVSFSTFTILYFSRITENKYHTSDGEQKPGSGSVFYFGFIIFALMIASMLMFHYSVVFFKNIKGVAIMGFLVSCIATGFSMGYGYLFRNLTIHSEFLLERINILSDIIYRYSRPFVVNYTSNGMVRHRIYQLQHQMLNMIANRQELSVAIAGGYDLHYKTKESNPKHDSATPADGTAAANVKDAKPTNVVDQVISFFKLKWLLQKEQAEKEEAKHNIVHNISTVEMKYFAEKSEMLGELNHRIKELKVKLEKLDKDEEDYLRNEGVYRSLKDQIKNMEEVNRKVVEEIVTMEKEILFEGDTLRDTKEKLKLFLKEGYQTGLWFKTMNNDPNNGLIMA